MREAAVLADRTPETIRRWVWSGRLPADKRGNRLFVARSAVEALSRQGRGAESAERQAPSLRAWSQRVARARRSGLLPAGDTSAADLVLADRSDQGSP